MLYLFSLCNLGWGITGLVSDVDIKTIARMNECQGTELEVHFLVENFLYIFYLCIFIISLASEPTIRLIRGTGLPFVNCCSYLISASILSSLELTPCCGWCQVWDPFCRLSVGCLSPLALIILNEYPPTLYSVTTCSRASLEITSCSTSPPLSLTLPTKCFITEARKVWEKIPIKREALRVCVNLGQFEKKCVAPQSAALKQNFTSCLTHISL